MLSVELLSLSDDAKMEVCALFAHAAWAGMNLAFTGDTRFIPTEEDLRSSLQNVKLFVLDPDVRKPGASHTAWMADKISQGWKYGPERDNDEKIHPCLVPFTQLPIEDQRKDHNQCGSQEAILTIFGLLDLTDSAE